MDLIMARCSAIVQDANIIKDSRPGTNASFPKRYFFPVNAMKTKGFGVSYMSGLKQILVVDDEKLLLLTTRVILERAGFKVTTAQNGSEALQRIKSKSFTLAIVDLRMPGLDGLDLILEIRKKRPNMPIVVFAANGNDDSVKEALTRGADAYLVKPIDPSLFLDKVRDIAQLNPA